MNDFLDNFLSSQFSAANLNSIFKFYYQGSKIKTRLAITNPQEDRLLVDKHKLLQW